MEANRTTSDEGNRPRLIATVGLPGSGKSTWARQWVAQDPTSRIRVCRDDIRSMITGLGDKKMIVNDENFVTEIQNASIEGALKKGYDVVVDATHLRRKNITELDRIARRLGADLDVNDDFVYTPLELCISRNAERGENAVPEDVVRTMHTKFLRKYQPYVSNFTGTPVFEPYTADITQPKAYVVDIDGTLALMDGRSPYDESRVGEDKVNIPVARIVDDLFDKHKIVLLSGRSENARQETVNWLFTNGIYFDELWMRAAGDQRKDDVVKYELFNRHVAPDYNVLAIFDDRNQVVKMWRDIGLTVFQVADGDF